MKMGKRIGIILLAVVGLLVLGLFIAMSLVNSPIYAWRVMTMGSSDTGDIHRFPERVIENGPAGSPLAVEKEDLPENVTFLYKGQLRTENLQALIERTDTAAFVVVRDDRIIYQDYPHTEYGALHTSFSVAKSFDSAMIGAAIADGSIGSVDDPVIQYIPEIAGRGVDELTIRNLIRMDSGIRYRSEDDILSPFSDDAFTYYSPDMRKIALSVQAGQTPIGAAMHYNNFHPLLEGMIIERATGLPVAQYLQERIWKPMGAEFPASWSLDSEQSGFEKMESGINAAAVDFARFGLIYLHDGAWNGQQILPASWVRESTAPDPADTRPYETMSTWPDVGGYYGYHWWGLADKEGGYDFMAQGHLGQIIYVSPRKNMVVVRFGPEPDEAIRWTFVIQSLVEQMN